MNLQILIATFVVLTAFQYLCNKQVEEDALDVFDDKGESLELKTFTASKVGNGALYRKVCTLKLIFTNVDDLRSSQLRREEVHLSKENVHVLDVQIVPAFQSGKVLSVLHPPYPLASDSKLESELERKAEEQLASHSSNVESDDESSVFVSSPFSDLTSAVNLASANARIRRESQSRSRKGSSQAFVPLLENITNRTLQELVLIPSEERRPSVIITPAKSLPKTSTPSNSPPPESALSRADLSTIRSPNSRNSVIVSKMEAAERAIFDSHNKLKSMMFLFNAKKLNLSNIHLLDAKRDKFEERVSSILESLESLLLDFRQEMNPTKKKEVEDFKTQVETEVSDYQQSLDLKAVELKMQEVNVSVNNSNANQSSIQQALQEQNELNRQIQASSQAQTKSRQKEVRDAAIAKVKVKVDSLEAEYEDFHDEITDVSVDEWVNETDINVSRAMKKFSTWDKNLFRLNSLFREVQEIIAAHSITEDEVEFVNFQTNMLELPDTLKEVKAAIFEEDKCRDLYTLDAPPSDLLKLPTFSGNEGEDYLDFKEKMQKGLIQNRVTRADKIAKLRLHLKGHALKLIPESLTGDINQAWETLDKMYGDPTRLVRYKKKLLLSLGDQPRPNGKGGIKAVIEWHLQVESNLKNLLDLGRKDTLLAMEIWNNEAIASYCKMFPEQKRIKLKKCYGSADTRLENIIRRIASFRSDYQLDQDSYDTKSPVIGSAQIVGQSHSRSCSGGSDSDGTDCSSKKVRKKKKKKFVDSRTVFTSKGLISFKSKRDESCRICKALEARGDTLQLYDGHFSNYPTGCPRYIAFNIEERRKIATEAKFCWLCHDPKYFHNQATYRKHRDEDCYVGKGKKTRFTCTVQSCKLHMWVCLKHHDENREALEKFKREIKDKHGLLFGWLICFPPVAVDPIFDSNNVEPPNDQPKCSGKTDVASNCGRKSLSTDEAYDLLKKKLKKKGLNEELEPIPKGRPQYILAYTQGKTRPILQLYDTGCGGVLFKENVPEKEIGPAVIKRPGPFIVGGVGDTMVKVNDEWMCSVELIDGTRIPLEGCSLDHVTSSLDKINLTIAENELKSSCPSNQELQNLKCSPCIGGEVDILIGMFYLKYFPKPVHSLPNGLTIYSLQIRSHDGSVNAAIGGPHESFAQMGVNYGSMAVVFANLTKQLENFKNFGPPSIQKALMSKEDMEFAHKFKELEMENDFFNECNSLATNNSQNNVKYFNVKTDVTCFDCGVELSEEESSSVLALLNLAAGIENDESVIYLKQLQQAQQEGLDIQYRCPKCRQCTDCRRSHETERISLREEAEDQLIWDSIKIDWKNKRIVATLPLRGAEEEFLSNNRDIALRILDQQCKAYHNDEVKDVIVKAFDKLKKNGHMVLFKDLSEEEQKLIESKAVSHYIVWRVVFKPSLSTPCRPVFDGSANTKQRSDGSGGRCLNDLVVKGRVSSLNLVRMVMRFCVGAAACQGDLSQFYASIKLDPQHWNLQRVLFKDDLNPDGEVLEAIICSLIWGVKSVSGQSETAMMKLSEENKLNNKEVSTTLVRDRFVDDLGKSKARMDALKALISELDEVLQSVGFSCKGWTFSGEPPPPEVCEEGNVVGIGGMKWHSVMDLLEIPIPIFHLSKKSRGRLVIGTDVFDGKIVEDLEDFVKRVNKGKNLSKRQIFMKFGSFFDILGKLIPIENAMKLDLRDVTDAVKGWDEELPDILHNKWIKNFLRMEKLKGLKFNRAVMPTNAVSSKLNLISGGDTSGKIKNVGVWGRFLLDNGQYSCQLIIGRSLLANSTIPKDELDALMMTTNLNWVASQALDDWYESSIVVNDSTISLCWTKSEKKRLSLYHRNRVVQIRRGVELNQIYHVVSAQNPSDCGTRPDLVLDSDIGPGSRWENGLPWMKGKIEDAVTSGILTPIEKIIVKSEDEDSYNEGFVFEKSKEILTRGHPVLTSKRVDKVLERSTFSNYLIPPTKFSFEKTVRIYSLVFKFIRRCRKEKSNSDAAEVKFQIFAVQNGASYCEDFSLDCQVYIKDSILLEFGMKTPGRKFSGKAHVLLDSSDISYALEYLFKKGTAEVKKFHKSDFLDKIAVERNGILYSRNRILDGQRLSEAGGLEELNIFEDLNINFFSPVLDRFSMLSYSIADYIHRSVSKHKGYESSYRDSLNFCFIIQGMSLFRELIEECTKCSMLRKKFVETSMGKLADEQMMIAPPFWVTMVDIYGPCLVYVPGHTMALRNRKVEEAKVYVLCFVCPTTKLCNLQVIEAKSADGVIDGINRFCCEAGVPSYVLVDQDSGIMKGFKECEVNLRDVQYVLHKEKGIKFQTVPVGGHNYSGACERKIRAIQDCLTRCDVGNMRLHATGYQTFCKLVENDLNNCPIGYAYGRDSDNSPILRLICPNILRFGRNNSRCLEGPVKLPSGPSQMMKKVNEAYKLFFRLWDTFLLPKLMKLNKWFDDKYQLQVGDIVYFQKEENNLSSRYTVGKVVEVVKSSKDGLVRRVSVQYQNASENKPRTTDRAARTLIKLFNIDDTFWNDDMAEVEKLVDKLQEEEVNNSAFFEESSKRFRVENISGDGIKIKIFSKKQTELGEKLDAWVSKKRKCERNCCCPSHCAFFGHGKDKTTFNSDIYSHKPEVEVFQLLDRSWMNDEQFEDETIQLCDYKTGLMSLVCAVNTDLGAPPWSDTGSNEPRQI